MASQTSNSLAKRRVFVADDHPLLRDGVVQLINRQEDLSCCGEAASAPAVLKGIPTARPDLVLLDLRMGSKDGFDLIRTINVRFPAIRILVLSQYEESLYVRRALLAGASGYVTKERATDEVLNAIRSVLAGETYLSSNISTRVLEKLGETHDAESLDQLSSLSSREIQVFRLIASGKDSKEIALKLTISPSTVETYRDRIKRKLDLTTGQDLSEYAAAWHSRHGQLS